MYHTHKHNPTTDDFHEDEQLQYRIATSEGEDDGNGRLHGHDTAVVEELMLVQGAAAAATAGPLQVVGGWHGRVIQISVRISNERSVHFVIYPQPAVFATLS